MLFEVTQPPDSVLMDTSRVLNREKLVLKIYGASIGGILRKIVLLLTFSLSMQIKLEHTKIMGIP